MASNSNNNRKVAVRNQNNSVRAPRNTNTKAKNKKAEEKREQRSSLWSQIVPYLLILLAIVLFVFLVGGRNTGAVGTFIFSVLTGLFGGPAYIIPFFLIYSAVMQLSDRGQSILGSRLIFSAVSVLLASIFIELCVKQGTFNPVELYNYGNGLTTGNISGGGVLGGFIGECMLFCFKSVASFIITIALFILTVMLTAGFTPKYVYLYCSYKFAEWRAQRALNKVGEDVIDSSNKKTPRKRRNADDNLEVTGEQMEIDFPSDTTEPANSFDVNNRRHEPNIDIPVDGYEEEKTEDDEFSEESEEEKLRKLNDITFDEVMFRNSETKSRAQIRAEKAVFDGEDLDSPIFIDSNNNPRNIQENEYADGTESAEVEIPSAVNETKTDNVIELSGQTSETSNGVVSSENSGGNDVLDKFAEDYMAGKTGEKIEKANKVAKVKHNYVYPKPELLSPDKNKKGDIKGELHDNADRLVKVLESFGVKTTISGVSRGPTITRYEIVPEAGVRVKTILNLVDDISLALATTGVRIEAPIPGKSAVGIEVPNKTSQTVYLRELIESDDFQSSKSKITACLGKDVAGAPIIMDIKKMPHLLIAGATGMGKSVCINSILMSLMYKAGPDDLKLILIDPKKVEFVPYNGLPHLLVPVVSDAKKAAGSLQWAVNEMERRYALIESVGVRDLAGYNDTTKNDPDYDYLPQIVIVIDELYDLMLAASNEVENSIGRIAAKARAAGIHLIIGTQRPSVDVITGVIKANIPSRIACTVASQTDSRTILDRAGAENLIGRGDMLYSPVGSQKPMRVQGAFVSDSEVEAVVSFVKKYNKSEQDYDEEIISAIDSNAAIVGNKKGAQGSASQGGGEGESEGDPLTAKALEIAIESGKISTSLLQRRLSVGYGRAAKIIDHMQEMGYVSEPDGQKPREVLITREQYDEMRLREETIE